MSSKTLVSKLFKIDALNNAPRYLTNPDLNPSLGKKRLFNNSKAKIISKTKSLQQRPASVQQYFRIFLGGKKEKIEKK